MAQEEISAIEQAWGEETWSFRGGGREDPYIDPIFVDYCVFHEGKHYPGRFCPHYKET